MNLRSLTKHWEGCLCPDFNPFFFQIWAHLTPAQPQLNISCPPFFLKTTLEDCCFKLFRNNFEWRKGWWMVDGFRVPKIDFRISLHSDSNYQNGRYRNFYQCFFSKLNTDMYSGLNIDPPNNRPFLGSRIQLVIITRVCRSSTK